MSVVEMAFHRHRHLTAELDLRDVVVQTQSTVVEKARQRLALVDEVVHGFRERRLLNKLRMFCGDPVVELGKDRFWERATTQGVSDAAVSVRRRTVRVVQQANEANPNHGGLAVHRECIEEPSARVHPAADLDDAGLTAIEFVVDAAPTLTRGKPELESETPTESSLEAAGA